MRAELYVPQPLQTFLMINISRSWAPRIDLFHKGYKTTIKPFAFLTELSGVRCKGLIVRFTKNAVQSYIFRKKISKNKRSCYKNIQRKCRRHLRPAGSGNTHHFGLPHRPPNMGTFSEPPRDFRDFEYLLQKKWIKDTKIQKVCPLNFRIQDPGPAISTASTDTVLYSVYDRYSRSFPTTTGPSPCTKIITACRIL